MSTVKLDPAKGIQLPNKTTSERNAISSPETGAILWNTTTSTVDKWNGSAWSQVDTNVDITGLLPKSGGAMTGAITTNSTFDGRDVAADGVLATNALPKAGGAMTGAITTNSTFDGVDIAVRDAILTSTTTTAGAALPKAGGSMTGILNITTSGTGMTFNTPSTGQNSWITWKDGGTAKWEVNKNTANNFNIYSYAYGSNVITFKETGNIGIGTTSPAAKLDIAGSSNTVGSNPLIKMGESAFRVMTGGEEHMLCLDRDNAGGTKKVMQSWNPDNGNVAIGSAVAVAAGRLMIKSGSLTQAQIKLQGLNYSFGAEIMSQNGSESGTVGNTRCWYKHDLVTNGNVRRFWTASSQVGTDTQSFSIANNQKIHMSSETIKMNHTNLGTAQDVRFGGWVGNGTGYGVKINTGSPQGMILIEANVSTARDLMHFNNSNGLVGRIQTSGSGTSYLTSSDYRLKENVDYTWDATTRLKQLKPARFSFIADNTNTLVDGFLAHEVGSIVPEAITGTKDGMKDEAYEIDAAVIEDEAIITPAVMGTRSVIDYQSIDQSKLVPLLVKTIQELEARITALEA